MSSLRNATSTVDAPPGDSALQLYQRVVAFAKSISTGPVTPDRAFELWESDFCRKVVKDLCCTSCKSPNVKGIGVGGVTNQFGSRLLQVKCSDCGSKPRLKKLLEISEKPELFREWNAVYESFMHYGPDKKKKEVAITDFFGPASKKSKSDTFDKNMDLNDDGKRGEDFMEINVLKRKTPVRQELDEVVLIDVVEPKPTPREIELAKENEQLKKRIDELISENKKLHEKMDLIMVDGEETKMMLRTLLDQGKSAPSKAKGVVSKGSLSSKDRDDLAKAAPVPGAWFKDPKKRAVKVVEPKEKPAWFGVETDYCSLENRDPVLEEPNLDFLEPSWADVTKKSRPANKTTTKRTKEAAKRQEKKEKKVALSMVQPRAAPLEFERLHLKMTDSRAIKNCSSIKEVNKLLWKLCSALGIRSWVFEVSRLGNSLMEIYVRRDRFAQVLEILEKAGIEVIEDLDLMKAPEYGTGKEVKSILLRRLSWLYRDARLVRLRECILGGLPREYQDAIKELVTTSKGNRERFALNVRSFFEELFEPKEQPIVIDLVNEDKPVDEPMDTVMEESDGALIHA